MSQPSRNAPCPCGSTRKYKHCCAKRAIPATSAPSATQPTPPGTTNLPSLQHAITLHSQGHIDAAVAVYQQVLRQQPNQPDALHYLGVAHYQKKEFDTAATLIERAIVHQPATASFHNNLGNVYKAQNKLDQAVDAYTQAIALQSGFADAHANLGNTLSARQQPNEALAQFAFAATHRPAHAPHHENMARLLVKLGRYADGAACYQRVLALDPDNTTALCDLGAALLSLGQPAQAVPWLRRALARDPQHAHALSNLGGALRALGQTDESVACLRRAMELDPQFARNRHLIDAMTGQSPAAPPPQYVEKLFDGYAGKFDTHLVHSLGYQAPRDLVALLGQHAALPMHAWNVLDLGCGTGLMGLAVAPHAHELVGVDLSANMLEKARTRGLYTRLEHADLLSMMLAETRAHYHLVAAADVFVYLGRLDEVVAQTRRLLAPEGYFVFTVEALEPNDSVPTAAPQALAPAHYTPYRLTPAGRYAHHADYLATLARAHGMQPRALQATTVRTENGQPLPGWLVIWQAP